ncbi:MAG TPA: aminodeoxychorismate synthase component I, partial [Armatimonadota bacterium]|nr:aminodeoxychorismate synthase component I [Armatimonadota bacterium]
VSYEAAPAFDPAMRAHPPGPLPLLWFGLYPAPVRLAALPDDGGAFSASGWTPELSRDDYDAAIARIKAYIAAGETYQVNYTLRLRARLAGSAWAFFLALTRAQRGHYGAWVHLGSHILCSASPELFFRLEGDVITCKPMKGTARRGLWWEDDRARARELAHSAKNRAENVMIVDMVRNDLGRIAKTGSVRVTRLCDVERYATVWQMTSTVTARTRAAYPELFQALFPCASITGAPKVHTTALIAGLETSPRDAYTGAIGWLAPGRKAQFTIAIRTAQVDVATGELEYGTGGGIVWDSAAESEYDEALTKTLVLTQRRPEFRLLETLRWRPGRGYDLRHGHLRRLRRSADYFGFTVDLDAVRARLEGEAPVEPVPHRVRLLVAEHGAIEIQATPLPETEKRVWRVALAPEPVDPADPFLYHKTTHRAVYAAARAAHPEADDVLLWNPRGELTEATIATLAVRLDGRWLTPPIACGLLPGVMRAHLLRRGVLTEAVITRAMLAAAEEIALINSVRGWLPAELMPQL